eukprot:3029231-Rhodomonas_salina.1
MALMGLMAVMAVMGLMAVMGWRAWMGVTRGGVRAARTAPSPQRFSPPLPPPLLLSPPPPPLPAEEPIRPSPSASRCCPLSAPGPAARWPLLTLRA